MSGQWHSKKQDSNKCVNLIRWFKLVETQPLVQKVVKSLPGEVKVVQRTSPSGAGATSTRKEEGKFVDLPGAEEGKVIVRFPPEASG